MNDLINKLTSGLDLDESQAKGGVGMLMKFAREHLGGDEAEEMKAAIPDADEMERAAPEPEVGGGDEGGLMGMLGDVAGAIGGEKVAGLAGLASGFGKLGIDMGDVSKFLPMVMDHLKGEGKDGVVQKLMGLLNK